MLQTGAPNLDLIPGGGVPEGDVLLVVVEGQPDYRAVARLLVR